MMGTSAVVESGLRRSPGNPSAMPLLTRLEERRFLSFKRVVVPRELARWYRDLFEKGGLFSPRRSEPEPEVITNKARRKVFRLREAEEGWARARRERPHSSCRPGCGQDARPPEEAGGGRPAASGPAASGPGEEERESRGEQLEGEADRAPPGTGLILKEEFYPFPTILSGLFVQPHSAREFHNLLALRALGIAAVEPLAHGSSGFGPFYRRAFLITRELRGATDLSDWASQGGSEISPDALRRRLMRFAGELAGLHRARVYVRTLYGKNLLARQNAPGDLELVLCDVPRLLRLPRLGLRFSLAARDLATLEKWARTAFPPRARLAFLKAYLEALGEGPPLRRWVSRIVRSVERMRHRTLLGLASKKFKRMLKRYGLQDYWPF